MCASSLSCLKISPKTLSQKHQRQQKKIMNSKFSKTKRKFVCFTHSVNVARLITVFFAVVFLSIYCVSHTLCPRCLILLAVDDDAGYSQIGNPNGNDTTEKRNILFIVWCSALSRRNVCMCFYQRHSHTHTQPHVASPHMCDGERQHTTPYTQHSDGQFWKREMVNARNLSSSHTPKFMHIRLPNI